MKEIFIDTNIFLRYLMEDHKEFAKKSKKLISKIENGKYKAKTSVMVIAEVIWTLRSFYDQPKKEIIKAVDGILSISNLYIIEKINIRKVLKLFSVSSAEFIDCYNYVLSKQNNIKNVASFDDDWDPLEDIERITK